MLDINTQSLENLAEIPIKKVDCSYINQATINLNQASSLKNKHSLTPTLTPVNSDHTLDTIKMNGNSKAFTIPGNYSKPSKNLY